MAHRAKAIFLGSALAALLPLFAACGSGSGGTTAGASGSGGAFYVKQTFPANNGQAYLNQPIQIEFTQEVDLASVDFNSVSFSVLDPVGGQAVADAVIGEFAYYVSRGVVDRRVVEFLPAFPSNDTFDNGGFRPNRLYQVHVNGGDTRGTPVVRSVAGRPVEVGFTFAFRTPQGATPQELFLDILPGGPRKVSLSPEGTVERLNFFLGATLDEVRLIFNQPLNPASINFNQDRIFMQYQDPARNPTGMTRLPATLKLARNLPDRAEVSLTPDGVLPSNGTIQVIVEADLQDLAGESNAGDPTHNRIFGTFQTDPSTAFQYDAFLEEFDSQELFDVGAAHREPLALWKGGKLQASFDFGGSTTLFDFEPTTPEVLLNTDFTQVVPKQGIPFTVSGGVFEFRNITIPNGVKVRGQGSNPLVFLATGDVIVRGLLTVDGGAGARVDTLNAANFPTPGGLGVCGGGKGGRGSPNVTNSSAQGEDGYGPGNIPGGGGKGGHTSYGSSGGKGAGGGGGSHAVKGDPLYGTTSFTQRTGVGGDGVGTDAVTRSGVPKGGAAGPVIFTDADANNDFFGRDVKLVGGRDTVVHGELKGAIGGAGGGGGGDLSPGSFPAGAANFANDNKGGGGGGGAGILIIKAIGRIIVEPTGYITANGGYGGGGEQAGGCNQGGGGAGGSGGMIVLQSAVEIRVDSHTGANNFAVSADGGVGTSGSFGGATFESKYPVSTAGATNRGGFGGLGLIQFMVPDPDNNITFVAGQVKPAPVRLPSDFGYLSRARSKWLFTGATDRQTLRPTEPRYLDNRGEPGKYGPEYRFAGLHVLGKEAGFIDYRTSVTGPTTAVGWAYTPELALGTVATAAPAGTSAFHVATVAAPTLGAENGLRGARLQTVQGATVTGEWLILGNTADTFYLSPKSEWAFTAAVAGASYKVVAKYFDVWTEDRPGLPLKVDGKEADPTVNVRIGFAACSGFDQNGDPVNRHPATGFAFDLENAAGREAFWKDGQGKPLARPYVMFDVLFNLSYNPSAPNEPRSGASLTPDTPRPELRYLVLPFRF